MWKQEIRDKPTTYTEMTIKTRILSFQERKERTRQWLKRNAVTLLWTPFPFSLFPFPIFLEPRRPLVLSSSTLVCAFAFANIHISLYIIRTIICKLARLFKQLLPMHCTSQGIWLSGFKNFRTEGNVACRLRGKRITRWVIVHDWGLCISHQSWAELHICIFTMAMIDWDGPYPCCWGSQLAFQYLFKYRGYGPHQTGQLLMSLPIASQLAMVALPGNDIVEFHYSAKDCQFTSFLSSTLDFLLVENPHQAHVQRKGQWLLPVVALFAEPFASACWFPEYTQPPYGALTHGERILCQCKAPWFCCN